VGAGEAFRLLAESPHAIELRSLWRFTNRWEANATRGLRDGNPTALDAYVAHGRLHNGETAEMLDAAYQAWATDTAAGHSSVLIAPDRETVSALNQRARHDRVAAGLVEPHGVHIADGATAGPGDVIVTRRNDRRLRLPDGGHIRNGSLWRITATGSDGSIHVAEIPRPGSDNGDAQPAVLRLPAEYVRADVELGYATTVHRAQGITVDTSHAVLGPGTTRQALYVAMTRGSQENHAYATVDGPVEREAHTNTAPGLTGRQILEAVLENDSTEESATATLRKRQNAATARLRPIHDALAARRPSDAAAEQALIQINAMLRIRSPGSARHAPPTRPRSQPGHDPISR
jgi:ATP-dependent exoDNAse (exonuclease V) alpha subunit